jgi:hypothetical protein
MKRTETGVPTRPPVQTPEPVRTSSVLAQALGNIGKHLITPVRTVANLVRSPGKTIREHLFGNRENVTGPGHIAFFGVTIYLLVNAKTAGMGAMFDPLVWWKNVWPYVTPLLLLPIAALQKRLFRKFDMTFAETFSFGLYMVGQIARFRALVMWLEHVTEFGVHTSLGEWIHASVLVGVEMLYVAWSATGFYGSKRLSVWVRGALSDLAFAALSYTLLGGIVWYALKGMFG